MDKIPQLYLYLFRNIIKHRRGEIICYKEYVRGLRTIIRRAPSHLYLVIAVELEEFGLIERINHKYVRILNSPSIDKQMNKLKDNIFPLVAF